jgi:hypothetical protein
MATATYLVFGDLHGRILPAFRLALAWQRDHRERLTGLLQVGDLGYFPDVSRLDKATRRHAECDPLELGTPLVAVRSRLADAVFAEPACGTSSTFWDITSAWAATARRAPSRSSRTQTSRPWSSGTTANCT